MAMMFTTKSRRVVTTALAFLACLAILLFVRQQPAHQQQQPSPAPAPKPEEQPPAEKEFKIQYLPEPEYKPPPIKDPFSVFDNKTPMPPVPAWNAPRHVAHEDYGFDYGMPLLIGFTRTWPILFQCVVSYVAAGWPASQIYVIENTGVQLANKKHKLSLQNPYYLGYRALEKLGVKVVRTPALLSFGQLQSFFTYLAHENDWPYYFWSHSDVVALPYEEGFEVTNDKFGRSVTRAPAGELEYMSLYEAAMDELQHFVESKEPWAQLWFAYDHLSAVNRDVYDEVGGWDPFIPYYMNDCDFNHRVRESNHTQVDAYAGRILDVNTVLDDLHSFFRVPSAKPSFTDPNPKKPEPKQPKQAKRSVDERSLEGRSLERRDREPKKLIPYAESDKKYFQDLKAAGERMENYKKDAGRNTWQTSQQGGHGEPFYYPASGISRSMEFITDAGRNVYKNKWGTEMCNLEETPLKTSDIWRVKYQEPKKEPQMAR